MGIWHIKSKRKKTGGLLKDSMKKRKSQRGSLPTYSTIKPVKLKQKKIMGGKTKTKLISSDIVNVLDKNNKKIKKAKIMSVLKNNANPNFVTRKIMTKGAIVKTNLGNVEITSRPGQNPVLNGVLVK